MGRECDTKEALFNLNKEENEDLYYSHLLECYKFFSGSVDAASKRRQVANAFYLTLNTAFLALIGYTLRSGTNNENLTSILFIPIASLLGLVLSHLWFRTIKSHKQLNIGKFDVILLMEKELPFAPYTAEWKSLEEGKNPNRYQEITNIESRLPKIFAGMYVVFGTLHIVSILVSKIGG